MFKFTKIFLTIFFLISIFPALVFCMENNIEIGEINAEHRMRNLLKKLQESQEMNNVFEYDLPDDFDLALLCQSSDFEEEEKLTVYAIPGQNGLGALSIYIDNVLNNNINIIKVPTPFFCQIWAKIIV